MKIQRLQWLLAIGFLSATLVVTGCGKKSDLDEDLNDDTEEGGGAATPAPPLDATVTGHVVFTGAAPAPSSTDVGTDPICTSKAAAMPAEVTQEVAVKDGKLANVFVYVSAGLEGKSFPAPAEPVVLDQQGCRYHPHVLGVMVGQTMQVKNDDNTMHNIHGTPTKNKAFNVGQPTQGQVNPVTFDQEEVMVPVSCDVHGWMHSYIGVLPHPCYAISKPDGSFEFKAPAGEYTVTAWHEKLGTKTQKVTVAANGKADITFTFGGA
jgi:plastocyanin